MYIYNTVECIGSSYFFYTTTIKEQNNPKIWHFKTKGEAIDFLHKKQKTKAKVILCKK